MEPSASPRARRLAAIRQLARLARPRRFGQELARVGAKLQRRITRPDLRTVTLPPLGEHRGHALLSYVIDGYLVPAALPDSHTHFWDSVEMGRALQELGFEVVVVHWTNDRFVPEKPYAVAIDVRHNLERWAARLPRRCLKIFHGETAHWRFHQAAAAERHADLLARTGVALPVTKPVEENRGIEIADAGMILGNEHTLGTYAFAGTPLEPLTVSTTHTFPDWSDRRDPGESRRRFLWFGGGGLVHKGLDRVLEALAGTPGVELTICGPISRERAFERLYDRHLHRTPNVHTEGWVDVGSERFAGIAQRAGWLIYPSSSESQCAGVITCMHAGIVPVISIPCGIPLTTDTGVLLDTCSIEEIRDTCLRLSATPPQRLAEMSAATRAYASEHHTREAFGRRYREALGSLLERHGEGPS